MPFAEYQVPGPLFAARNTNKLNARRAGLATCAPCLTPKAADENSCRILWTPNAGNVYWSSLPSWTGNITLTYPTTDILGNGAWLTGDPFAYTINGSNLTFDNPSLISGPMWQNTDLGSFSAENPGPIAWIMEDNPCQEGQTWDSTIEHPFELGSTSYTVPADLNDVHANDSATRVAYGPTVSLKITETVYVFSSLEWLGDSGGAASNHSIKIGVVMTSAITERWCVVARSSGGTFGNPLVLTFSIEDVISKVGPNDSYQLDSTLAWSDAAALPSVYTGATTDLIRPVTGGGPETPIIGPFQDLGSGVYRRATSGVDLNEGILNGDNPGSILWSRNQPA